MFMNSLENSFRVGNRQTSFHSACGTDALDPVVTDRCAACWRTRRQSRGDEIEARDVRPSAEGGALTGDWLVCLGVASSVLWLREASKLARR
jgi:hypothetical protein